MSVLQSCGVCHLLCGMLTINATESEVAIEYTAECGIIRLQRLENSHFGCPEVNCKSGGHCRLHLEACVAECFCPYPYTGSDCSTRRTLDHSCYNWTLCETLGPVILTAIVALVVAAALTASWAVCVVCRRRRTESDEGLSCAAEEPAFKSSDLVASNSSFYDTYKEDKGTIGTYEPVSYRALVDNTQCRFWVKREFVEVPTSSHNRDANECHPTSENASEPHPRLPKSLLTTWKNHKRRLEFFFQGRDKESKNSETLPNASEVIGPTKPCCSSDVHAVGRFCSDSNSSVNYKNDYPDKALVLRPRIFTVSAAVYSSQNRSTEYDPYDSYAAYRGHGLFLSEAVTTAANGLKDIAPVDLCPTDPGYAQESSVEFGDYDYGCLRASTDEEVRFEEEYKPHEI